MPSRRLALSPVVARATWETCAAARRSRELGTEGLMLKRLDSGYGVGRPRGVWWKWKVEPYTLDAVLIYAQKGSGKRASLNTDYTFGIWKGDELVPFAKAYSGLTDEEIREVDAFIRQQHGGAVRSGATVKPELVFELGFEGIQRSPRHKSGIAVRFPRMLRMRKDKAVGRGEHASRAHPAPGGACRRSATKVVWPHLLPRSAMTRRDLLRIAIALTVSGFATPTAAARTFKLLFVSAYGGLPPIGQGSPGVVAALAVQGFVEGRNLELQFADAWMPGSVGSKEASLARAVARRPDAILRAEHRADSRRSGRYPIDSIVFWNVADPVASGIVASSRPARKQCDGNDGAQPHPVSEAAAARARSLSGCEGRRVADRQRLRARRVSGFFLQRAA